MKRRMLAILLTLCMILGMMPATAFAITVDASNYAETLEELGYTFTLSGVHIIKAGYYKLDGTKVDSEAEADVQVTDPVNKKMTYLNGTTWQDVSAVFATEHTAWEKEAVGVYVAGVQITESGYYNNDGTSAGESGPIYVDIESKKITLNGATIEHTTGEMTLLENIVDPDYTGSSYQGKSLYDNITGVPGVLVITESVYKTPGSGAGAGNWDCYYYWPIGYNPSYKFGSIALGIMVDDESGAAYDDWTIELRGENTIHVNNTFGMPQQIGYLLDAPAYGIFAESNLTITGTGSLETVVNNEWDILKAGYMDYQNSCVAGGVWALGNLSITGGTITAETSTKSIDTGAGFEMTHTNYGGAIGATGSVSISGEETIVSATDTTSQGSAIRGTTGVTITESATVTAESSSDIAGTAIMAGASQWSGAPIEISEGAKVTAKAESTNENDQFGSGMGIVAGIVDVKDAEVKVDAQAAGINAGNVSISSGDITVNVSHENGKAVEAQTGDIAVGSFNTPIDSDLIADSSVIADGSVMPKDELAEYTARIEKTYYTGEDGGNKAITDLVNKQVVWLNTDTTASRDDYDLGNTVTIMLAEGKTFTGQLYGSGVKADIVEGNQEELDGVLYTEYIYTMVVNSEDAGAKVVHEDGTETYYKELFGSDGCIYVTNKLSDGDTVVVLKDSVCDYYGGYDLERDVTLDLNGKTLTFEDTGGLNVEGTANDPVTVTIIDSSEETTGKIINTYNPSSYVGTTVSARQYSEVTIEGGTYDGKTQSSGGKLILAGGTYLREVVAGTRSNVIGTTIVSENADITECEAYADGGILILPNQTIGGDISKTAGTDDVQWKLVDAAGNDADYEDIEAGDCKLVIFGTGEMMSFSREDAPWIGYDSIISEIIIEDGVTNISDSAFEDMNGHDITLGNGITNINQWAFEYCKSFGVITIPEALTVSLNNTLNYNSRTVEDFVVADENTVYSFDDKALYYTGETEGKKLMKAVASIEGNYEIEDGTVDIKARAFDNVLFESLVIPESFENVYTFRKPEVVPEGMVFGGYYTSLDDTVVEELRIDTTGDDENEAFTVYMILGYEVTYNFGNTEEVVVVPTSKTVAESAPNVIVDGKTLVGWSTTEDGTETDASALKPTEAMTVYAIWDVDEDAEFDYNGITIEPIANQTYTGEEIKPAVYYKDAQDQLKQVAESYLVFTNNVNAGEATVSIKDTAVSSTFVIDKAEFDPRNYAWTDGETIVTYSKAVAYDGQKHSLYIEELPEGITVSYTYGTEAVDGVSDVKYNSSGSVTDYVVTATFDLGSNYEFVSGLSNSYKTPTRRLTIKPLEVTITVDDKTMYVGEDNPAFTYTVEGLGDGMTLTTEPTMATSASGNKVGNFPITASGAVVNNDANNFKIIYEEGYLTVGMKILDAGISFANDEVTYDGNVHTIEIDVEGTLPDSFSVDYTMDGQPFTGVTNAGIYVITANITSTDPAYDEIEPLTAELTIVPAELIITAEDKMVRVGNEMPELTYKVEGLIGSDTVTTAPALTTDADLSRVGEYTITASGADAGDNYTIEYVNGTLTVKKASGSSKPKPEDPVEPDVPTKPFIDVDEKDYFYDSVMWAVKNGVTGGTSKNTFSPDATCTRAQTVTFLWNAAGKPEPKSSACPFTDVAPTAYYYKAVLWAVEEGITSGTSATTFGPNETVTRGQNVTFLWKFANKPMVEKDSKFVDVTEANYYHDAVVWAAEEGITSGTSATTFGPENPCTRAQIVTFLYRHMVEE